MKIQIETQERQPTEELLAHVDRHVRFALTRFTGRVRKVGVEIRNVEGNGRQQECRIRVELSTRASLVVREADESPFTAVARATSRIGHVVSRHLDRVHQTRRRNPRRALQDVVQLSAD